MRPQHNPLLPAVIALLLSLIACRPVFAIGWDELFIIVLLVAFLLGPLLFRLGRAWSKFKESERKRQDK